ncbi:MAG TPA: TRAP transporter TatT component family protein [Candidatus Bipolaricaulis anaerobius]|nr:TRAP transporter TatT component family protein [Candidatus Bipolaricaulis anaerobius]HNS23576.1 TRAP transporter TatT component family protein [Candidatus Bipolaricaulis anaerobius]
MRGRENGGLRRAGAMALVAALGVVGSGTSPQEKLVAAEALYNRWDGAFDFTAYEARLQGAISLWEEALAATDLAMDEREAVLVRLSRAYFELAEAYLPDGERRAAYAAGEAAGLAALRLDPEFARVEGIHGFRAALGAATEVGAIFWYGNNLGRSLNYDYGRALFGGTRDVLAAFTRAVELDEAYWGGGPHRALANFLAQTPGFLGGDQAQAGLHFAHAVELDPAFVQNYVDWAEFYAKPRREWDTFCRLLHLALAVGDDPAQRERWPLYNHLALARATALRAEPLGRCP